MTSAFVSGVFRREGLPLWCKVPQCGGHGGYEGACPACAPMRLQAIMTTKGTVSRKTYLRRRIFVCLAVVGLLTVTVRIIGNEIAEAPSSDSRPLTASAAASKPSTEREPQTPSGPPEMCVARDIQAVPTIEAADAVGGRPVKITLNLTTTADKCRWTVSAETVVLKVNSDGVDKVLTGVGGGSLGDVWTTQDCGTAVPTSNVVLRPSVATSISVTWLPFPPRERVGDAHCPGTREWMQPGRFTVLAAAFGGEPSSFDFQLRKPQPTVRETTRQKGRVRRQ